MTHTDSYTSDLLSHFVGTTYKGEPIDTNLQYERLAKILRSGCLSSNALDEDPSYECYEGISAYRLDPFAVFTNDQLYVQWCVCFCDIPEGALAIHSSKYGRFGLGFKKSFLVPKGASPAFYVAIDAKGLRGTHGAYFDERIGDYLALRDLIFKNKKQLRANPLTARIEERFANFSSLLDFMVLGLLKPFDSSLPDDAPKNSYMEREWRVLGDVAFTLADVAKVYVAQDYEALAREQFPEISDRVVTLRH